MNKLLDWIKKNKRLSVCLLGVIILFIIILFLNRGTYSTDDTSEESDALILNCPDTSLTGGEVECSLGINLVDMTAYGISAKFNVSDGIEFVDVVSEKWEISSSDINGFVLVNLDGVTGNVSIGTVRFKMPSTAMSNEKYNIGLTDITVGDGEETVLNLESVSDEIRIKSSINTLDSITLTDATLNETFDKEKLLYTANSDTDKINIDVVKTDEYSEISGDIGEMDIHYGTNIFNIVVTSEVGTTRTYTLSVYKEYMFTSDKYICNEENKYIYGGSDVDEIILSNIQKDSSLNYEIVDNVLIVKYNDELLKEYKLVRISSDLYELNKEYIYVGTSEFDKSKISVINGSLEVIDDNLSVLFNDNNIKDIKILSINLNFSNVSDSIIVLDSKLDYSDFISNIAGSDNLVYRVFNDSEIINSGFVMDGMILKIYYNDLELDSYNISEYSLTFDSSLTLDEENKYINFVNKNTIVKDMLDKITVVGGVKKIYDRDNLEKGETSILATGDKVVILRENEIVDKYTISVNGDANGDGIVNLIDLVQLRKQIVKWEDLETGEIFNKTGVYYNAIDLDKNGDIGLIDLVKLRKIIVGIE